MDCASFYCAQRDGIHPEELASNLITAAEWNPAIALRGAALVFAGQTLEERSCGATLVRNAKGFCTTDASVGTRIVSRYRQGITLEEHEVERARGILCKYRMQILHSVSTLSEWQRLLAPDDTRVACSVDQSERYDSDFVESDPSVASSGCLEDDEEEICAGKRSHKKARYVMDESDSDQVDFHPVGAASYLRPRQLRPRAGAMASCVPSITPARQLRSRATPMVSPVPHEVPARQLRPRATLMASPVPHEAPARQLRPRATSMASPVPHKATARQLRSRETPTPSSVAHEIPTRQLRPRAASMASRGAAALAAAAATSSRTGTPAVALEIKTGAFVVCFARQPATSALAISARLGANVAGAAVGVVGETETETLQEAGAVLFQEL